MSRAITYSDFEDLELVCFDNSRCIFVRIDSNSYYHSWDPFDVGTDRRWQIVSYNPHGVWNVQSNGYLRFTHQNGYFEYDPEGVNTTLRECLVLGPGGSVIEPLHTLQFVYFRFQGQLKTSAGTKCKLSSANMERCYAWFQAREWRADPEDFFDPVEDPEGEGIAAAEESVAFPPGDGSSDGARDDLI